MVRSKGFRPGVLIAVSLLVTASAGAAEFAGHNVNAMGDNARNAATTSIALRGLFGEFVGVYTPEGQILEGGRQNKPVTQCSSTPLTWQYASTDGSILESGHLSPQVSVSEVDCQDGATLAEFPGSSDLRYGNSIDIWRLNWTAPSQSGCFALTIDAGGQSNGPFMFRVQ